MSPKDINTLQIEMEYMKKAFEEMKEAFKENQKAQQDSMNLLIAEIDKKYAAKWAEKVLVFVGCALGVGIIWAIMSLIFIKPH